MQTFTWLGALLIAGFAGYLLVRIARQITREQAVTIGVLGVFVLLGILTARHAWMAAYINYDHATEFLVYAHGAPANKTVVNYLEEMSRRSAEGRTLNIAYNDEVSWPGSWYFRDFPNARFVGGLDNPESANLTQYDALVVGDEDGPRIEPLLSDAYYKFDYVRLWWPMQEYFDLNATRIDNALGDSGYRRALWDIWWNRDYTTYDQANDEPSKNFTLGRWYVADRMHFFVRKDLAAQIWDLGVGAASVGSFSNDPFANLRCDTCAASTVFDTRATALNSPRGITVGPDKNVYVVDNQNSRIVVYDPQGNFVRAFGVAGAETPGMGEGAPPVPAPMGAFWQPWGIAVDKEGTIYIADTWNHRVQILSNDGTPIRTWGQLERIPPGSTVESVPDGFFGPRDIEVDANGLIYVADTGNHRVRVYDINGTLIRDIGTYGTQPGQLKEPVGLAISDAGELYVASTWSKTISVFKIDDGRFSRQWNVSAWNQTTETTDTGNRPYIALDNTQSRLLITDHDAGRIMVYDINGMPQVVFGRIANDKVYTFTAFGVLGGIATDPDTGTIYLSDAGANRILRFEPQSIPGLSRPDLRPRSEETDIAPTDAVETEAAPESESF
jgi:DNA-binding beta-propeller fold protein YncE